MPDWPVVGIKRSPLGNEGEPEHRASLVSRGFTSNSASGEKQVERGRKIKEDNWLRDAEEMIVQSELGDLLLFQVSYVRPSFCFSHHSSTLTQFSKVSQEGLFCFTF